MLTKLSQNSSMPPSNTDSDGNCLRGRRKFVRAFTVEVRHLLPPSTRPLLPRPKIMTPVTLRKHMMVTTLFNSYPIPIAELILSIYCGIPVPLWCYLLFVSSSSFSVALDLALASQFTSYCESQQLSHN